MKWPWQMITERLPVAGDTGGQQARERAERELEQTREQTKRYRSLASELRAIRERNGLADAFLDTARRSHR